MDTLIQDLKYGIRLLARAPGFTAVAVVALALGIGANTAIFTVVNAVLLERLPYHDPDRIVALWETSAKNPGRNNVLGPAQFVRWSERVTAFEATAALVDTRANLTGAGDPEEVVIQNVTASFFPILGVSPMLGRTFSAEENADPQSQAVILSYDFWQRRFGGDRDVVGRTIQLNGRPNSIVGVMPPGFRLYLKAGSLTGKLSDLWSPWVLPANSREAPGRFLEAIARLKPGVSIAEAQTQLTAIAAALATETPARNTGWGAHVVPLHEEVSGEYRQALLVLAGAVGFVLLIACANVVNLLLARGAARQRELAIRTALGAGRLRVVRQLLTESFVLAALGGVAGLLVAQWSLALLLSLSPIDLTATAQVRLSYPVLGFTAMISLLTAIACGLAPAFAGSRTDVQETLKDGARQLGGSVRHRRLRQAFVVAEIALASVLLVGAGLMLRSFRTLQHVNPGFDTSSILTMRLQLPAAKYADDAARIRFFRDAEARIAELPGVKAVGAVSFLPLSGLLGAGTGFTIAGQPPPAPGQEPITNVTVCDNGYFSALNLPLVRGRLFTEREMLERANVVIVSESLARTYFPRGDAIGQRLSIAMTRPIVPTEVIGIVADIKFQDLTAAPRPTTYWPHPQLGYSAMTLAIRTATDPMAFSAGVQQAIRTLDKDQPVSDVKTMTQWVSRSVAQARFSALLLAAFAALALLLASVGIYGVVSYAVSQRTAEIGIRLALGAQARDVLRMVVANGIRLAAIGLAIGMVLALALSRTLGALLYETNSTDPATFAAVVAVLGTVTVAASYLPARRASRIAPTEALRYQ